MRKRSPFQAEDLQELDALLLDPALAIVPMERIAAGWDARDVIGLRHDVDNVIDPAVRFAEWEADRGYRSTYYVLHHSPYWSDKRKLRTSLERIAELGHEIGIHNNALAVSLLQNRDPVAILSDAIDELRGYGYGIRGTVAHGDGLCYDEHGKVRFVNDELFVECPRPEYGEPNRKIGGSKRRLSPISLSELGLEYEANWLHRGAYLSDSGGKWSTPFDRVASDFPYPAGQLHILIHPDWWPEAFPAEVRA